MMLLVYLLISGFYGEIWSLFRNIATNERWKLAGGSQNRGKLNNLVLHRDPALTYMMFEIYLPSIRANLNHVVNSWQYIKYIF